MNRNKLLGDRTRRQGGPGTLHVGAQSRREEGGGIGGTILSVCIERWKRIRGNLLCDIVVESVENGSEFLDEMRAIGGLLELVNDADHDIIVDALGVDPRCKAIVHGRRRWRVLPGGGAHSGALLGRRGLGGE